LIGRKEVKGTAQQEERYQELWLDYWKAQAAPMTVTGEGKPEEWGMAMAMFAFVHRSYELALLKGQIDIWATKK
jgi:hypothetical protein